MALGIGLTQAVGAVLAPRIGAALDRYPIRRVQAIGATSMGVGFLLLSLAQTPLQFYLVLGAFIGFGAGSMGQLATSKLVANWFVRRRGTALGIAATGISVSGVVMPGVSALIIGSYGWRQGFLIYGVITLAVVVPLVLRYVISKPEDVGLRPDGALADTPLPPPSKPWSTRQMLTNRNFVVLVLVIGLLFCIQSATLIHMVPRLTDMGFSLVVASSVMSVSAALGIAGKVIYGALADRWDVRYALWLGIGFQIAGQFGFLLLENYAGMVLAAALFGFGMGGVVPLQGAIVGAAFGREAFGKVLGAMRPPMAMIQVLGVPFAGWVFDAYGSYDLAFEVFIVLYLLTAGVVLALRVVTKQPGPGEAPSTGSA